MTETEIMRRIMVDCADIAILMRYNVGLFYTQYGTQIKIGVKGTSDLIGFRLSDNKFVAIEVKTETGRPTKEQKAFLAAMRKYGCIAGIARNSEQARKIINGTNENQHENQLQYERETT